MIKNYVVLFLLSICSGYAYYDLYKEKQRVKENYEQMYEQNSNLNLTVSEFKEAIKKGDKKIDSLMRANKIRPITVQEVIRIETNYTDTVPKIIPLIPLIPIDTTLYSGGISFKLSISDSLRVSNITANNSNTSIRNGSGLRVQQSIC